MSERKTWRTMSHNLAETESLAADIGARLRGGEMLELVSDLGGGKTAFVRGLAHGMGSTDHVASPTFTISREYHTDALTLYHLDFYRLHEPGIMSAELAELVDDPHAVVAVEWSDIVQHILPDRRVTLTIRATSEGERELTFAYPSELQYLINQD